jgi:FkbM family methyltransferase
LATRLLRHLLKTSADEESQARLMSTLAQEISSSLSRGLALKLKDEIRVMAPLDYAKSDIRLDARTAAELVRLSATAKEPWTVSWIETLRAGHVLFDVGANVGAYSLIAARQPGRLKVFAFEPSFENYAALCRNIAYNDCAEAVTALPIALGARTGIETFNYYALDPGSALHTLGANVDYRGQTFEPKLRQPLVSMSLDDAVSVLKLPVPSHIKIDVDGTEMDVLHGAGRTLSEPFFQSLLIEICEYKAPSRDIVALLARHGLVLAERHDRPSPPGKLPEVSYLRFDRSV